MSTLNESPKPQGQHRIAIVGAGAVGARLATQFVRLGHSVTVSNSRGPDTLRDVEKATGAVAMAAAQAVSAADIVILAVPLTGIIPLQPVLQQNLRPGTILINACNYYPALVGHIQVLDEGAMTESVWMSETFQFPVVKAFNNIIAHNLVASAKPKGSSGRVALPVSGDDDESVATVMELMDSFGFDAYKAGKLADSWRHEAGNPAYCTEPTLAELPGLLSRADRDVARKKRDQAMALAQKLPPDFPPQTMLRLARLGAGLDWGRPRSWVAVVEVMYAMIRGNGSKGS